MAEERKIGDEDVRMAAEAAVDAMEIDAPAPGVALSAEAVELGELLTALLKRGFKTKPAADDPDDIRLKDLQFEVNQHILLHNRSALRIAATGSGKQRRTSDECQCEP